MKFSFRSQKYKKSNLWPSAPLNVTDSELLEMNRSACTWPGIYYENIETLARLIECKTILEVGVAWGYLADHLLRNLPSLQYTGIDPYLTGYDENDAFPRYVSDIFQDESQRSMDRLFVAVQKKLLDQYSDRAHLIRKRSLDALNEVQNETFDLIFLDGDHRFSTVAWELESFWPRVSQGGILAGDDYDWPDVARAANEFAIKITLPFNLFPN
jgi:hypothetical protein